MSNPAHMWSYWRDKKGIKSAIEDYYPEHLLNVEISHSLIMMKMAGERQLTVTLKG